MSATKKINDFKIIFAVETKKMKKMKTFKNNFAVDTKHLTMKIFSGKL